MEQHGWAKSGNAWDSNYLYTTVTASDILKGTPLCMGSGVLNGTTVELGHQVPGL